MKTKRKIITPNDIQKHYNIQNVLGYYINSALGCGCGCAYHSTYFYTTDDENPNLLHKYCFYAIVDEKTCSDYNYNHIMQPVICDVPIISFYDFYNRLLENDQNVEKIICGVLEKNLLFYRYENVEKGRSIWLECYKEYCKNIVAELRFCEIDAERDELIEKYVDLLQNMADDENIANDVWKIKEMNDDVDDDDYDCYACARNRKNARYYF
jgi:hypothetical protein